MSYADSLVDAWINAGLQEAAGAGEFEDLKLEATVTLVAGTYEYTLPSTVLAVTSVGFAAEDKWLIKATPELLRRMNRDDRGIPKYWAKRARKLILYKTPDRAGTLDYTYWSDATNLVAATDVTQLPVTWDEAVFRFAASTAFYELGDDERGLFWFDRAVKYAGSRMMESERGSEAISMPIRVATSLEDLHSMGSR